MTRKRLRLAVLICIVLTALSLGLVACDWGSVNPVIEPSPIEIRLDGVTNLSYYVGDSLNFANGVIVISYTDGSVKTVGISEATITGYDKNKVGEQTVTVAYQKLKDTVKVTVSEPTIQNIEIAERPEKILVVEGVEQVDLTGVSLRVNFETKSTVLNNLSYKIVSGYTPDLLPGKYTVQLLYAGKSVPLEIEVVQKSLVSVAVSRSPEKTAYFLNEDLKPEGAKFSFAYDNGKSEEFPYEDIANDLEFNYSFRQGSAASRVEVIYKESFRTSFTVTVSAAVCDDLTILEYPVTQGVMVEGVRQAPTPHTAILQGDVIDWSTGKVWAHFNDGTGYEVSMDDTRMTVMMPEGFSYDIPNTYTVRIRYTNVNWDKSFQIQIVEKTARRLSLYGTENVVNVSAEEDAERRVYVEGERISLAKLRYNVLFNNGEYLCDPLDFGNYPLLTVSMLSADSTLTIACPDDALRGEKYEQTVTFTYQGVRNSFTVDTTPKQAVVLQVSEPTKNYIRPNERADLTGSTLYYELNNREFGFIQIPENTVTYYFGENTIGDPAADFSVAGVYTAVVEYEGLKDTFRLNVQENLLKKLELQKRPNVTPHVNDFEGLDFRELYGGLTATYDDGTVEKIAFGDRDSVVNNYLYKYDSTVTGNQNIYFRYLGKTVDALVEIEGKSVTSVRLVKTPDISVYLLDTDPVLDWSGMIVAKIFSDGTERQLSYEEMLSEGDLWRFTELELNQVGQFTLRVEYFAKIGTWKVEFPITVLNTDVKSIEFDDTQEGLSEILCEDGETRRVLVVSKGEDLNTVNLKLKVIYANDYVSQISLQPGYIGFDKNVEYRDNNARKVKIAYGGKETEMWVYVTDRVLVGAEVYRNPTRLRYAEGQYVDVTGGAILRTFERKVGDSTVLETDILWMTTDMEVFNYDSDPFSGVGTGDRVEQNVYVTYRGIRCNFKVWTYRKLRAVITYQNTVSFYGSVTAPGVMIDKTLDEFTLPSTRISYVVNGEYTDVLPLLPGYYPIRVTVEGNEYYQDMIIEDRNLTIVPKVIEVSANDAVKYYTDLDPVFTYRVEGDRVVDGVQTNTVLVWNNGVQDKIEIRLVRDAGEDVKRDATGALTGYAIRYELANGDNQNDRYRIDFKPGILVIRPYEVSAEILFADHQNQVYNGKEHPVRARFVMNGSTIFISAKDMRYYRLLVGDEYEALDHPPVEVGNYRVEISDNYLILGDWKRYADFTVASGVS